MAPLTVPTSCKFPLRVKDTNVMFSLLRKEKRFSFMHRFATRYAAANVIAYAVSYAVAYTVAYALAYAFA